MKSLLFLVALFLAVELPTHAQGYSNTGRTANDYMFGHIGAGQTYHHEYTPLRPTYIPMMRGSTSSSSSNYNDYNRLRNTSRNSYFTSSSGGTYTSRSYGNTSYVTGPGGFSATAKKYGNTTYVTGSTGYFNGLHGGSCFRGTGKTYGNTTYITGSNGYSATAKTVAGTTYVTNNRTGGVKTVNSGTTHHFSGLLADSPKLKPKSTTYSKGASYGTTTYFRE